MSSSISPQAVQGAGLGVGEWVNHGEPLSCTETPRASIRSRMEIPLTGVTKSGAVQNGVRSPCSPAVPAFQGRAQGLWLLMSRHSCPLLSLQRAVTQPNRRAAQFPSVPAAGGAVSMEMSLSVLCSGERGSPYTQNPLSTGKVGHYNSCLECKWTRAPLCPWAYTE